MGSLGAASAAVVNVQVSPEDERAYRHLSLANGMQILLIQDVETDKAAASMDVKVGQLSDPPQAQGLAHFCEHMLFLGTKAHPEENSYSAFLAKNAGWSNAFTSVEDTNYFFEVAHDKLREALSIFSHFFISPLFTESCTERELTAVDNENSKNLQSDQWRVQQLYRSLSNPEHPYSKFGTGNMETLRDTPAKEGVDIRAELLAFHAKFYSANQMCLSIVGRESLDEMQGWVTESFSPVVNKGCGRPSFVDHPPAFGPQETGKRICMKPVKELREVQILFPIHSVEKLFMSKPQRYLSHLIGHEGKGSLLSWLKEKGWANELCAGIFMEHSDWSGFGVHVECTEEGLDNADQIIEAVFSYIGMLRREGPKEWIFEETKKLADIGFRFANKKTPSNTVLSHSGNMQSLPPELCVAGAQLLYEYAPAEIEAILLRLVPSNMVLVQVGKRYEDVVDCKERWYGTEYSQQELPAKLLQRWANAPANASLHLPEPNPLIPSNFELREVPDHLKEVTAPVLLRGDAKARLWYKHGSSPGPGRAGFTQPKLYMKASLQTPVVYESPESFALSELFTHLFKEEMNEFNYEATSAGMNLKLNASKTGLEVSLGGFSHKMPVLVQKAVEMVAGFAAFLAADPEAPALFTRVKDKLRLSYQNMLFHQPYQHSMQSSNNCLFTPQWSVEEKSAALLPCTLDMVLAHIPRITSSLFIEALVVGNASPDEAAALLETFFTVLKPKALPGVLRPDGRVVQLSKGVVYSHRMTSPNPEEPCSAVQVIYPMGLESLETCTMIELVVQLVKERAFDQLRTKEGLGYLVWSAQWRQDNCWGVRFIIQSNEHGPGHLDERIEAFLTQFRGQVVELSEEEWEANKEAVVAILTEKDKSLVEETTRSWGEISVQAYDFERNVKTAEAVKGVAKDELLAFMDTWLLPGSKSRHKLRAECFGKLHQIPLDGSDEEVITNPSEFKRTMPLFPLRAKPEVDVAKL